MSFLSSGERQLIRSARIVLLIVGILALLTGIAILGWPEKVAQLMVGVIAAYLIFAGLTYLGLGLFARSKGGWARAGHLLLGLLYIAAGGFLFFNLATATLGLATLLAIIVGVLWIIDGLISLSLLGPARSRAWTLIYAILSILGGIAVLLAPLFAALLLWWIFGITLVLLGIVQIVRALVIGRVLRRA